MASSLADEAIGVIDRRQRAPFVGEWPPNVECSVESTRKTQRKIGLEVNARFSQASHWNGIPDEVKPNLGFRV